MRQVKLPVHLERDRPRGVESQSPQYDSLVAHLASWPFLPFFYFILLACLVGNEAETLGRWNIPFHATTRTIRDSNMTGLSGFSKKKYFKYKNRKKKKNREK